MLEFVEIGFLDESNCDFSELKHDIGVYKAELAGKVVYVGKATELDNGGLRKRLRDYTRVSDSARNFPAGIEMNRYASQIVIYVMKFPREIESVAEIGQKEAEQIMSLRPTWN
ncbi:hypothetical protein BZG78_01795 [Salinivibrio sp. MA351]|nr:hypothetical protein BZG78_01795 [Salinivibrio sp. MA351]